MAVLPPNVSQATFDEALRRFGEVVGEEWVFSSNEDVDLYRDAYSPSWGEPCERNPVRGRCAHRSGAGPANRPHRQ